ncbi:MAG: hypothetical protein KF895_03895 [Parvibaculum sp.]|nr:hypothetical protein [Parvibaculum sp.]
MKTEKLYKHRARKALPILVRQAKSKHPIFYKNLAEELGMPNPRNLDYVLGDVGRTLGDLNERKKWRLEIPQIQALVINQKTGMPGHGFDGFLKSRGYHKLSALQKRQYLPGYWNEIFAYPYWSEVLEGLGLAPVEFNLQHLIERAKTGRGAGGGEGEEHRRLKEFVAERPTLLGLPGSAVRGQLEYPLPSGDRVDVLFESRKVLLGVEVKSNISNEVDIIRGLFQCVKYKAVLAASASVEDDIREVGVALVLGRNMPVELTTLQNSLGVKVVEVTE